jgi:hypothetical protein
MPQSICPRSPGPSFAAQPDALTVDVNLIIGTSLQKKSCFLSVGCLSLPWLLRKKKIRKKTDEQRFIVEFL